MKEQDQNKQQQSNSPGSSNENESTPVYLNRDTTLQTPEEAQHDKSIDPRFDDQISVQDHNRHPANSNRKESSSNKDSERRDQ